jgi:L-threonylcarbamoyladenylate synthase
MNNYNTLLEQINAAVHAIKQGKVIAYPTEAVYGLGADPTQESAVTKLYQLKKRDPSKGCIIVAANWDMVKHFTKPIPNYEQVFASWPGHVTWVFPASNIAPCLVQNHNNTIAIRISAHPIIQKLCTQLNAPIISTSANIQNEAPATNAAEVIKIFGSDVEVVIDAELGQNNSISTIKNALDGTVIR